MRVVPAHEPDLVATATALLDAGELALLPLDGAYALCADALDEDAAQRVRDALGRSADEALPVLVAGYPDVQHVAFGTTLARDLAARFWPGPLAMLLRARPWMPDAVTAGLDVVAVRAPASEPTRALAAHFGPLVAVEIAQTRHPRASLVVDAGPRSGAPDTLVDATGSEAKVLREGAVRAAEVVAHGR